MARIFFSLLILSLVSFTGCHHVHGVCDCDQDEAPCTHRAPWAFAPGAPVFNGAVINAAPQQLQPGPGSVQPTPMPPAPPPPKGSDK